MPKSECYVTVTYEAGKLTGTIKRNQGDAVALTTFDPLTVLPDLIDTVYYENISSYVQDNYFFKEDYLKHPFFSDGEYTDRINKGFPHPSHFVHFYNAVHQINDVLTSNKKITLSQLEVFKQFYNLKFTYKIEFLRENPMYQQHELVSKYGFIKNAPDSEFQWETLSYNDQFDISGMFKDNKGIPMRFTYTCHSLEDIIFSVWHYLIMFGYKYSKCQHCDKYVANLEFRKYCHRNSPYKGYTHLSCNIAVDHIEKNMKKRKNSRRSYLSNYYPLAVYDFLNEFDALISKEVPKNVNTFYKLEHITSKQYVKEKWHKKEYE